MQLPTQITFRGMAPSDGIVSIVRDKAAKLDEFYERITACRVVVEAPHRRHYKGNVYHVRIDLTVPGDEIVVHSGLTEQHECEDAYVALREAFDEARRKLQDFSRKRQGTVKAHELMPRGRVARIFLFEGFGFLETPDGREIYFHKNSVSHGAFDRLTVGSSVRFEEEQGAEGPQASVVVPGRPRRSR